MAQKLKCNMAATMHKPKMITIGVSFWKLYIFTTKLALLQVKPEESNTGHFDIKPLILPPAPPNGRRYMGVPAPWSLIYSQASSLISHSIGISSTIIPFLSYPLTSSSLIPDFVPLLPTTSYIHPLAPSCLRPISQECPSRNADKLKCL